MKKEAIVSAGVYESNKSTLELLQRLPKEEQRELVVVHCERRLTQVAGLPAEHQFASPFDMANGIARTDATLASLAGDELMQVYLHGLSTRFWPFLVDSAKRGLILGAKENLYRYVKKFENPSVLPASVFGMIAYMALSEMLTAQAIMYGNWTDGTSKEEILSRQPIEPPVLYRFLGGMYYNNTDHIPPNATNYSEQWTVAGVLGYFKQFPVAPHFNRGMS